MFVEWDWPDNEVYKRRTMSEASKSQGALEVKEHDDESDRSR
ncbi:hypothetical protein ACFO9Q_04490 [Paenibacillus sp. GCM10023252]